MTICQTGIMISKGYIPPYTDSTCRACGEVYVNNFPNWATVGLFARWYTRHDNGRGQYHAHTEESQVWCCSKTCAEIIRERHEGMVALKNISL